MNYLHYLGIVPSYAACSLQPCSSKVEPVSVPQSDCCRSLTIRPSVSSSSRHWHCSMPRSNTAKSTMRGRHRRHVCVALTLHGRMSVRKAQVLFFRLVFFHYETCVPKNRYHLHHKPGPKDNPNGPVSDAKVDGPLSCLNLRVPILVPLPPLAHFLSNEKT